MAQNPFKQPEKVPKLPRSATANMRKQRFLGYLNPPAQAVPKQLMADRTHTIANSKQSMDIKKATNLSTKLSPLKRQSSAGSGVSNNWKCIASNIEESFCKLNESPRYSSCDLLLSQASTKRCVCSLQLNFSAQQASQELYRRHSRIRSIFQIKNK